MITNINVSKNNSIVRLEIGKNLIKMLPLLKNICTHIDASENRLIKLDDLPKLLNYLNVSRNRIQHMNFNSLTDNLQYLNINHNFIRDIPYLPSGLKTFICCNNMLRQIPENLPPRLKILKICNNRITELPNVLPTRLKLLSCKNNNIDEIPDSIMNCNSLTNLKYDGNRRIRVSEEILEFIDEIVRRNRERNNYHANANNVFDKHVKTVYRDGQNVHDKSIDKSVLESLQKIIKETKLVKRRIVDCLEEFNKIIEEEDDIIIIEDDEYMYNTPYKKLEYLCSIDYKHIQLGLTYADIFVYVWNKIRESPYRNDIINILISELDEMLSVCFTGRVSRLVNCLNGFDDNVVISISETSQIQAKYDLINKKLLHSYDVDSLEIQCYV